MRVVRSTIHWPVVLLVAGLTALGLLNLFSALRLWGGGQHLRLFWLQCVWVVCGAGCATGIARYDYRLLLRSTPRWIAAILVLLSIVLIMGRVVGGNRNWLGFGGFGIQPSELAKLVVILLFAKHFTEHASPLGYRIRELVRPIVLCMAIGGLIALGGDLGTTLFIGLLGASMLLIARLRWQGLLLVAVLAIAGGTTAYLTVLTPAQRGRVTSFLHPEDDPRGKGYQVMQSKMAIGSGKVWGRGYLRGTVNKLRYLPEKHTDFVFPVWAEEWGFAGSLVVVIGFLWLITLGLEIAQSAGDRFGSFLAAGIVLWLFWQVAINLGGVLGLLPLTGVTLPFFSYGGSSMIVTYAAMGLLLSIHRRRYLF